MAPEISGIQRVGQLHYQTLKCLLFIRIRILGVHYTDATVFALITIAWNIGHKISINNFNKKPFSILQNYLC